MRQNGKTLYCSEYAGVINTAFLIEPKLTNADIDNVIQKGYNQVSEENIPNFKYLTKEYTIKLQNNEKIAHIPSIKLVNKEDAKAFKVQFVSEIE